MTLAGCEGMVCAAALPIGAFLSNHFGYPLYDAKTQVIIQDGPMGVECLGEISTSIE